MSKIGSQILLLFAVCVTIIMSYPIYRVLKEAGESAPPSYHEYTVLDLETGKKLIVVGDDNARKYHADDTAWRDDRILYPSLGDAPDNAMQVVVISTCNQLYE